MTNQTKINYLNYLINPTFSKVNRLFVLSFENGYGGAPFCKYYATDVETKYYTVVIGGKIFLMFQ